ncbi:MAG: copper amine oxidase N-terminal domain-containing protein [Clostridiales bacterium]|nr:copper amine oxidase N-terminal domain-containing protein [Clostridiales bacterium]
MKKILLSALAIASLVFSAAAPASAVDSVTARPTSSTVLVNGESVTFDAYNINGNNYFKLRDLAFVLSGTAKQFEVDWDGAKNAISLTSGKPYTSVGGEMAGKGAGNKIAMLTSSKIYLDEEEVSFTAYNIEDNNYFKLRDIGAAFDFGVDWDQANNTIVIDTGKGYIPEAQAAQPSDSGTPSVSGMPSQNETLSQDNAEKPSTTPSSSVFLSDRICDEVLAYARSLGYAAGSGRDKNGVLFMNFALSAELRRVVYLELFDAKGYWGGTVYWDGEPQEAAELRSVSDIKNLLSKYAL